jgi:hypothetical protein
VDVPAQGWYGQPGRTDGIRVANIYATSFLVDGQPGRDLTAELKLWRYEQYYKMSAEQFPRILHREQLRPDSLEFKRWQFSDSVKYAELWLFAMPSGQVVAAFSLDSSCPVSDTIDLLEDGYYTDISVGEASLESLVSQVASGIAGVRRSGVPQLLPERHQLICTKTVTDTEPDDIIRRLIYRTNLASRKEYSAIVYPPEMNRRDGWLAAVGPYVSVAGGHPVFIEESLFASVVQAVAAQARLREIRQRAYQHVRRFRSQARSDTKGRRQLLEQISGELGAMELELSFSVEAPADLSLLVPSLRAEGFHSALYGSMHLADKSATTARMLQRLEHAVAAELTTVTSIERRAEESRRLLWAAAVGFVSVIAVPAGLVLSFLGINASQVNPQASMFSHRYLPMYLTVAGVLITGALLAIALYLRNRHAKRDENATRITWVNAADVPELPTLEDLPPDEADIPRQPASSELVDARPRPLEMSADADEETL